MVTVFFTLLVANAGHASRSRWLSVTITLTVELILRFWIPCTLIISHKSQQSANFEWNETKYNTKAAWVGGRSPYVRSMNELSGQSVAVKYSNIIESILAQLKFHRKWNCLSATAIIRRLDWNEFSFHSRSLSLHQLALSQYTASQ